MSPCLCLCVCVCAVGPSPPGPPIRAHRSKNVSSSLERPNQKKTDMPSDGMPACQARRLQMLRGFLLKVRLHMHLHRKTKVQTQAFRSRTITPVAHYLGVELG